MTKTVVVTGAGGIGAEIARRLLAGGHHVVAVDRDASALDALRATGADRLESMTADVTDAGEVTRLFAAIQQRYEVRALIHTVGIADREGLLQMAVERFDRMLRVCTRSTFLCAQAAARAMVAHASGGRIVLISSIVAERVARGLGHYATAKAGVDALTRSFALELAPYGIAVNAVSPGTIRTRLNDYLEHDHQARQERLSGIPAGVFGTPGDVADVVTWLANAAPRYVTGSVIVCDGATSTMLPGDPPPAG